MQIIILQSGKDREELQYEPGKKGFRPDSLNITTLTSSSSSAAPSSSSSAVPSSGASTQSTSTAAPGGPPRAPPAGHERKDIKVPLPAATRVSGPPDVSDACMRRVQTEPTFQNVTHTLTAREYLERKAAEAAAAQTPGSSHAQNKLHDHNIDRHHLDALSAKHRPPEHRERDHSRDPKSLEHRRIQGDHRYRHPDPTRSHSDHAHQREKMRDPNQPHRSHGDGSHRRYLDPAAANKERSRDPHRSNIDIMKMREPASHSVHELAQNVKQEGQPHMHGDPTHSRDSHRTHVNLLSSPLSSKPDLKVDIKQPPKTPDKMNIRSPLIKTPPELKSDKKLYIEPMVKIDPLPPPDMLMAELQKPVKNEPQTPPNIKQERIDGGKMSQSKVRTHHYQAIKGELPRTPDKKSNCDPGLKIKLSRHGSLGTPPPPPPEKKDLKMKISLGGSPGVTSIKREEFSSRKVSPSTGDLKMKLDLKKMRTHESSPSKHKACGVEEYKLTNQGSNPLKLKLSLNKGVSSPGASSSSSHRHDKSRHSGSHHAHHSSKNGSSHSHGSSRKRPHSPQVTTPQQQISTSHLSKLARSHDYQALPQSNSWQNANIGLPIVTENGGNSNLMNVRPAYQRTESEENIIESQRHLQQLIALQQSKMDSQFPDMFSGVGTGQLPQLLLPSMDPPPPPPPPE